MQKDWCDWLACHIGAIFLLQKSKLISKLHWIWGVSMPCAEESSCDFQHWWGWQRTRSESDVCQLGMIEGPKDSQRGNFKAWWTCMKYPQGMYGNDVTVGWNVGPRDLQTCADWLALCGTNFWPGVMLNQSHCIPAYTWSSTLFSAQRIFGWIFAPCDSWCSLELQRCVFVLPGKYLLLFPGIFPHFRGKYAQFFRFKARKVETGRKWRNYFHLEKMLESTHLSSEHAFIFICVF